MAAGAPLHPTAGRRGAAAASARCNQGLLFGAGAALAGGPEEGLLHAPLAAPEHAVGRTRARSGSTSSCPGPHCACSGSTSYHPGLRLPLLRAPPGSAAPACTPAQLTRLGAHSFALGSSLGGARDGGAVRYDGHLEHPRVEHLKQHGVALPNLHRPAGGGGGVGPAPAAAGVGSGCTQATHSRPCSPPLLQCVPGALGTARCVPPRTWLTSPYLRQPLSIYSYLSCGPATPRRQRQLCGGTLPGDGGSAHTARRARQPPPWLGAPCCAAG